MQPQTNPEPKPRPVVAPPPAVDKPRRSNTFAWLALVVVALAGTGAYLFKDKLLPQKQGGSGGGPAAVVRTAAVSVGTVERTLRLTGVTAAEKFNSLVVPQLQGMRGGGGVTVQVTGGGGRGMQVTVTATGGGGGGGGMPGGGGGGGGAGGGRSGGGQTGGGGGGGMSGGGGGGGGTASADTSASTGTSIQSTNTGGNAGMAGFRSSSNRFGTSSSSASRSTSSSSARSTSSVSSAGSGMGGSQNFAGGGGMSGGANDFMQVLQSVLPPGSMVKKGEKVAEFDKQYQILRLDDYKANVDQERLSKDRVEAQLEVSLKAHHASIEQAKAAVEKAKLDIRTTPVRSQIQAELLKLALEEAEANLRRLESATPYVMEQLRSQRRTADLEVEESKRELARAEANVRKMDVVANMDGMLVMQNMPQSGEFRQIRQGDQLYPGMMFAQIVDPTRMLVTASVNQADAEWVRVGQQARLSFDAFPGLNLPAKVIAIGAMTKTGGQRAAFVKEIPVFLRIEKMDPRVIPDLSVSVDVVIERGTDQVVAPVESVFRDKDGKSFVFVKSGDRFEKRTVEIGVRSFIHAGIVSGLKQGDVVALDPPEATGQTSIASIYEIRSRHGIEGS